MVGTEIHLLVLVEDRGQAIILDHLGDRGPVVEMFDDVIDILGEAVDVGPEVRFEERLVFLIDLAQCPVGLVRKGGLLRILLQLLHQLNQLLLAASRLFGLNLGLLLRAPLQQYTFQTPDDDNRQDNILIFIGLEFAAQTLGGFPYFVGEIVEFWLIEGKGHQGST